MVCGSSFLRFQFRLVRTGLRQASTPGTPSFILGPKFPLNACALQTDQDFFLNRHTVAFQRFLEVSSQPDIPSPMFLPPQLRQLCDSQAR